MGELIKLPDERKHIYRCRTCGSRGHWDERESHICSKPDFELRELATGAIAAALRNYFEVNRDQKKKGRL